MHDNLVRIVHVPATVELVIQLMAFVLANVTRAGKVKLVKQVT